MAYTARRYQKNDEDSIILLLNNVFNGWPHLDILCPPIEYWRWKYQDNPQQPNVILVSESEGKIVGVNHSLGLRVKVGDSVYKSSYAADTAVHSEYRRKGISSKLIDLHMEVRNSESIQFTYFVTRNPYLIKMNKKYYPVFPHTIKNLVSIKNIDKQLEALPLKHGFLMKIGYTVSKIANKISNITIGNTVSDNLKISLIDTFDGRITGFWNELAGHYCFIVERNQRYLNWRYCDPRIGKYVVKIVEDDSKIIGYSVVRINSYVGEYPIGYIVDLLALPGRLDAAYALAADAVRYFDENKINLVNYQVVKDHPYEKIFESLGFLDSHLMVTLFYIASDIDENIDVMKRCKPEKIYFSYGDLDTLPIGIIEAE